MMKSDLELNFLAKELRRKLNVSSHDPIDIISVVTQIKDLTLVFAPMGRNISGLCNKEVGLIFVNSNFSYGRVRFTLAHELYHLYFDDEKNKKTILLNQDLETDNNEIEANLFASYFIAPYESFRLKINNIKDKISINHIYELEQYFGFSRQAVLYRLRKEGLIGLDWSDYQRNLIKYAKIFGYDEALYQPYKLSPIVYGEYLRLVEKLYEKDLISTGKRNELLVAAYKSDVVLGDFGNETIVD